MAGEGEDIGARANGPAGAWQGAEYDVLRRVDLPQLFSRADATIVGTRRVLTRERSEAR